MTSTRDVILRTNDLAGAKAHYHGKLGFATVADAERLVGFDTGSFILYFFSYVAIARLRTSST